MMVISQKSRAARHHEPTTKNTVPAQRNVDMYWPKMIGAPLMRPTIQEPITEP